MTTLDLSQFQSDGRATCFHGRHIEPQIYAGLDGRNWRRADYEARGGYRALRKVLTILATVASAEPSHVFLPADNPCPAAPVQRTLRPPIL